LYFLVGTFSPTKSRNCASLNQAIRGASLGATVGSEAYLARMCSRCSKWSMYLGLPEKYAGDEGMMRAGLAKNLLRSISGAGCTSVASRREDVEKGDIRRREPRSDLVWRCQWLAKCAVGTALTMQLGLCQAMVGLWLNSNDLCGWNTALIMNFAWNRCPIWLGSFT
jgi:hypothetical protein